MVRWQSKQISNLDDKNPDINVDAEEKLENFLNSLPEKSAFNSKIVTYTVFGSRWYRVFYPIFSP